MQAGSKEAFTSLYLHYSPQMFINIQRMIRDPLLSEEMVQELFTRIWQKRDSKGIKENFSGYLYITATNLVHDFFRKLKRDRLLLQRFKLLAEENYDPIEGTLQQRQLTELLKKAVEQLTPQQKKVYFLLKEEGYTYNQAAEELGISPFTIKEYLVAINKAIRNYINNHTDNSFVLPLLILAGSILI